MPSYSFYLILWHDSLSQKSQLGLMLLFRHSHHPLVIPIFPTKSGIECNRSKALGTLLYQEQKFWVRLRWFFALLLCTTVCNGTDVNTGTTKGNKKHHVTFPNIIGTIGWVVLWSGMIRSMLEITHNGQQWKMPPNIKQANQKMIKMQQSTYTWWQNTINNQQHQWKTRPQ